MSIQTPLTIREVVSNVLSGKYVLPSIQREFVWGTDQIERLFDSLLRDYPINSLLLWKVSGENARQFKFYRFLREYHERNNRHNPVADLEGTSEVLAVLDGQQRLTALTIGLVGSYAEKLPWKRRATAEAYPKKTLHIDLLNYADPAEMDFRFRLEFVAANEVAQSQSEYWIPLSKIWKAASMVEMMQILAAEQIRQSANYSIAAEIVGKLWECLNTRFVINYFLESEPSLDKVLQIFVRTNSGGTKLSYSDLLLSIATAAWTDVDARQEIHELVDELNDNKTNLELDKDFVLKSCLVLSDVGDVKFKVENFNQANVEKIRTNWPLIKAALRLTVHLAVSFGYTTKSLLSNNALIPIAYYLKRKGATGEFLDRANARNDREKIRRWLITALLRGTFSSMGDTVQAAIRGVLSSDPCEEFPSQRIGERLTQLGRSLQFTQDEMIAMMDLEYGDKRTFLVLSLLYPHLNYAEPFHVDHMHPRSRLTRRYLTGQGLGETLASEIRDKRDRLANLQLLRGTPNQEKADMDFAEWMGQTHRNPEARAYFLETNFCPADVPLGYDGFLNFIECRQELMLRKLGELLA